MSNENVPESPAVLIIDDVEYRVDALTNEQQYILSQVNDCTAGLNRLDFQKDQLNEAKQSFVNKLIASIHAANDAAARAETAAEAIAEAKVDAKAEAFKETFDSAPTSHVPEVI
jgi:flagellar biosynthesis/type III secretory pathway protein FliH